VASRLPCDERAQRIADLAGVYEVMPYVEDERTDAFGEDDRLLFERVGAEMGSLYE
jgi:hypothetical protein